MQSNASSTSKMFLAVVALCGLAVLWNACLHPSSADHMRFGCFLLVACLTARLKVKLPGLTGSMSVNLPFILVAVAEMSFMEAIAVACLSTFVQGLPRAAQKFSADQATFNSCNMALAVAATRLAFGDATLSHVIGSHPVLLSVSAAVFFVVNTIPVAIIIALTEARNVLKVWTTIFHFSFPYFVASGAIAGVVLAASERIGWQVPLFVLPVMFGMYHSYKRYFATNTEVIQARPVRAQAASAS